MTTIDGYTINQYPTRNAIVIALPQRWDTLTNTKEICNKIRDEVEE